MNPGGDRPTRKGTVLLKEKKTTGSWAAIAGQTGTDGTLIRRRCRNRITGGRHADFLEDRGLGINKLEVSRMRSRFSRRGNRIKEDLDVEKAK